MQIYKYMSTNYTITV